MKRKLILHRFGGPLHPIYCVGGGVPANTTTQNKLSPELAREIGPFADFAREAVNRPYRPFKAKDQVAPLNADQQQAFNFGRQGSGAVGQYDALLGQGPFQGGVGVSENEADTYLRNILSGGSISPEEQSASNFLGSFYDNRQNPYFEEQLGIGRKRIGEEYSESIAPGIAGKYALSGAFGGTAASEAESKSQRELARGLQEYESGSRSAEQERRYAQGLQAAGLTEATAGRRAGQGLQASGLIEGTASRRAQNSLADASLRSGLIGQREGAFQNDFTRLLGIGQQQQDQTQRVRDKVYEQFLRRTNYPRETFDMYRDAIAALTGAGGGGQSSSTSGGGPGTGQIAAGAATTAAALYALYASQAASSASTAATAATAVCWVAREVFGEQDPRWVLFRYWLLSRAPSWFRKAYVRNGPRWARLVNRHPWLKPILRWWMNKRLGWVED